MLLTAPDGRILAANPAACQLFGKSEAELQRVGRAGVVDAADPRLAVALRERERTGSFRGVLTFFRADGKRFEAEISTSVFDTPSGEKRTSMVVRDITDRLRAEEALRASDKVYREVVEDQTEVICRFDAEGRFLFVNDIYCRYFGKSRQSLIGRKWHPIAYPEDLPLIEAKLKTMSPEKPLVVIENRVRAASGRIRWMQFINRGIYDHHGHLHEIQAVSRDITELKEAEAALRQNEVSIRLFSRRLLSVREEEKRNLSQVLHHEVGSIAVTLSARLNAAEEDLRSGKIRHALSDLRECRSLFASSVKRLKSLAVELRPPALDLLGLVPALRQYLLQLPKNGTPAIRFSDHTRQRSIPAEVQTVLFRIAQESVTNAIKHADARRIGVRLSFRQRRFLLTVSDNGRGFDAARIREFPSGHIGLRAMREMVAFHAGSLHIDSKPGAGTTVVVEFPERSGSS